MYSPNVGSLHKLLKDYPALGKAIADPTTNITLLAPDHKVRARPRNHCSRLRRCAPLHFGHWPALLRCPRGPPPPARPTQQTPSL